VSDQLSLQRLFWVLRNDVMRSYRSALVISGTAALVALVISLGITYYGEVGNTALFYRIFFIAALFAWGTIATSLCFSDLHGRATNSAFLLLPASALEKTLSRLAIYTVGLIVYLLVLTTVLSWVLEGINTLWVGERRELFSPFDRVGWMLLPHFIVTQALFFLGAAWFRKVQFVKTVGSVIAIVIGLAAFAVLVAWCCSLGLLLRVATALLVRGVAARVRDTGEPWNLANRRAFTSRSPTRCAIASWPASGTKASASPRCVSSP
jgi:hypothetical protein